MIIWGMRNNPQLCFWPQSWLCFMQLNSFQYGQFRGGSRVKDNSSHFAAFVICSSKEPKRSYFCFACFENNAYACWKWVKGIGRSELFCVWRRRLGGPTLPNIEGMVWDGNWRGHPVVFILRHLHACDLGLWTSGFCVKADRHETPPMVEGNGGDGGGDREAGVGLDLGGMKCVGSSGRSWCTIMPAGQCLPRSRTESTNQAPEFVSPAALPRAFTWL